MMNDVDNKEVRAPDIVDLPCTLKNIDLNSGVSIPGAEFEFKLIHASWGSTDTLICNELGVANFIFPSADSYTIRQTKSSNGYALFPDQIEIDVPMMGMPELRAPINNNSVELTEESSGWILTVKSTKIPTSPEPEPEPQPDPQPGPEGGTKMKVATDNSLKELIKLVKSQPSTSSGGILNVTLDYTIPSYSPVEVETKRKRVYADIPCVNSKVAMNAQITPNDNIENVSLLTYAEPFDGYIRCYFSEQPTEAYIIDSVELTPVTSIIKKNKKS